MSLIDFPNVPNVSGVPALFRTFTVPSPGSLVNALAGSALASIFGAAVWGVFDSAGKEALTPDSFLDIDYKNDVKVSNYPQEAGAFASYNKVATPFDCRLRMAIGSDKAGRTAFLAKVDAMLKSIDLFTVITPEATYANATLQNYNYRREASNGLSLIVVDLWFGEVRQTAVVATTSTAQPSGADAVSDGQVQTVAVPQPYTDIT